MKRTVKTKPGSPIDFSAFLKRVQDHIKLTAMVDDLLTEIRRAEQNGKDKGTTRALVISMLLNDSVDHKFPLS